MPVNVTIVGSGIAAVAAALEALSQGAEVTVIGGRPGASALASGAWDIAHDPRLSSQPLWQEIPPPEESLAELIRRSPTHPYTLISGDGRSLPTHLGNAFERLSNRLSIHLKGNLKSACLALTPLGTVKNTTFTDHPQGNGNLLEFREARLLVIGFDLLPQVIPGLIASQLKKTHDRQKLIYCSEIFSASLRLKSLPKTLSPVDFAQRLDDDTVIDELHETLLQEATRYRATHVALPPLIGIRQTNHIFSRLAESSPIRWFEILGLPPSVPGLRLHHSITRFFRGEKLSYREETAQGGMRVGKRVTSLSLEKETIPVDRLILATGKFLGGGVVHDESGLREGLLGIPLLLSGQPIGSNPPSRFVSRNFFDPHPLNSVGIRVNRRLQPVDERGQLLCENVWAAGSLLGGYDPVTEGCGMGVAVGTGTFAGREASQS